MESTDSWHVEVVTDRQDPRAVERLLRSLPDWFGIEASLQAYVEDARTKPTYLAVDRTSNDVVGALLATTHNRESTEIHLMAVLADHHRQGIGRALVAAFESDMSTAGVRLLQVKTLGPSEPDEAYRRTLRFYRAMGYIPLEEFHGLWAENPCLILVSLFEAINLGEPVDRHMRARVCRELTSHPVCMPALKSEAAELCH